MTTMTGRGFYQVQGDQLFYGSNFVENAEFQLYADKWDQYEYPAYGWYWFESEQEARNFFSLPMPVPEPPDPTIPIPPMGGSTEVVRDESGMIIGYKVFHPLNN